MTEDRAADALRLTALLAQHQEVANDAGRIECQCDGVSTTDPGIMAAHQADMLARHVLPALLAAERAWALRGAADAWAGGEWRAVNFNRAGRDEHPGMRQARWLRERADGIAAAEPAPGEEGRPMSDVLNAASVCFGDAHQDAWVSPPTEEAVSECTCAMTEGSQRRCPSHGEEADRG